jgi:urea transport system permease protein
LVATAVSILIDATLITLVLALAASGLAVVFGLVGVINMGHGAMLTLGAYFTWALVSGGVPFLSAALLAAIGVGLIGLLLEIALIRHFYDRPFETLLLTWGFFLVATELIKIIFGSDFRSIPEPFPGTFNLGFAEVPAYRTSIALFTVVLLVAMGLVYYRTGLGIRIRALIQNREVASLLGLNVRALYRWVFAAGAFLAGLAGALISPMLSIDPYIGNVFLVRSFFVVTVGGLGQLLGGTVLGSFIIGGSETLFALVASQTFAQTIVFVLAILVLRFRPRGILAQQN